MERYRESGTAHLLPPCRTWLPSPSTFVLFVKPDYSSKRSAKKERQGADNKRTLLIDCLSNRRPSSSANWMVTEEDGALWVLRQSWCMNGDPSVSLGFSGIVYGAVSLDVIAIWPCGPGL